MQVDKSGLKSWIFRYSIHGKRREMGLGRLENLTLDDARKEASNLYQEIKENPLYDPIAEKQQKKIESRLEQNADKTFSECAEEFIELKQCEWTNPKTHPTMDKHIKNLCLPIYWGYTP